GAVRVGSTVTDGSSGRRSAEESRTWILDSVHARCRGAAPGEVHGEDGEVVLRPLPRPRRYFCKEVTHLALGRRAAPRQQAASQPFRPELLSGPVERLRNPVGVEEQAVPRPEGQLVLAEFTGLGAAERQAG